MLGICGRFPAAGGLPWSSCMVMSMFSRFCSVSCRRVSILHMKLNSEFSPMYLLLIVFEHGNYTHSYANPLPRCENTHFQGPNCCCTVCLIDEIMVISSKKQMHRDTEASIHDLGQKNMSTLIEALKHI